MFSTKRYIRFAEVLMDEHHELCFICLNCHNDYGTFNSYTEHNKNCGELPQLLEPSATILYDDENCESKFSRGNGIKIKEFKFYDAKHVRAVKRYHKETNYAMGNALNMCLNDDQNSLSTQTLKNLKKPSESMVYKENIKTYDKQGAGNPKRSFKINGDNGEALHNEGKELRVLGNNSRNQKDLRSTLVQSDESKVAQARPRPKIAKPTTQIITASIDLCGDTQSTNSAIMSSPKATITTNGSFTSLLNKDSVSTATTTTTTTTARPVGKEQETEKILSRLQTMSGLRVRRITPSKPAAAATLHSKKEENQENLKNLALLRKLESKGIKIIKTKNQKI